MSLYNSKVFLEEKEKRVLMWACQFCDENLQKHLLIKFYECKYLNRKTFGADAKIKNITKYKDLTERIRNIKITLT